MAQEDALTRFVHAVVDAPETLKALAGLDADLSFTTPDVDVSGLSFTSDDWDGDDAEASYPSAEDADLSPNYALVPESEEARDAKANFGLPFRESHEGQVNLNAVSAAVAAINGARGGLTGVTDSEARDAFDFLVELGVEGGLYDDEEDAPDFAAQSVEAALADVAEGDGEPDAMAASFSGRVTSETDTADLSAEGVEVNPDAPLTGVIWATGRHELHINGEPVPIEVTKESVRKTFERLQEKVQAGEVKLGADHFDSLHSLPVTEQAGLLELGTVDDVALTPDGENIVMTDSTLTNAQAKDAHEQGVFEDVGFSVDGDVEIHHEEGEPVLNESGDAIMATASDIQRVDLVDTGAVEGARNGNVPEVAATAKRAAELAKQTPGNPSRILSATLQATAKEIRESGSEADGFPEGDLSASTENMDLDTDDFDSVEEALQAASEAVEEKDSKIEELQAKLDDKEDEVEEAQEQANAFSQIAAAHGKDLDEQDTSDVVGDILNEHTQEVREEVAKMEASLASEDTDPDDIDSRVEELAAESPSELQERKKELSMKVLESDEARERFGQGIAAEEGEGSTSFSEGAGGTGQKEQDDELAASVLTPSEIRQVEAGDISASEFLERELDVSVEEHDNEQTLQAAVAQAHAEKRAGEQGAD